MARDELCSSGGSLTKYLGRLASEITAVTSKIVAGRNRINGLTLYILRLKHLAEDILCNENYHILIQISPTFAAKGPADSKPVLA